MRLIALTGLSFLLTACAFEAQRPAPVTELNPTAVYRAEERGSYSGSHYTVKRGDTLYSIAFASGKDYRQIATINSLSPPYIIHPGQRLALSGQTRKAQNSSKNSKSSPKHVVTSAPVTAGASASQAKNTNRNNSTLATPKKDLAKDGSGEYVETRSKQNVNQVIHKTGPTKETQKVSAWIWPAKGKLVGRYTSGEQSGNGIKISATRGSAVLASADGRVVYAGSALRGYGNLIIIKHNDDYLSAYAHNDRILVKDRQNVQQGQRIADMGSSGTNQVMLHFEIRYRGQSVDPLNFLPKQ
ncbi:peptidoglycan DD-metalloendopeptidase family protein [Paraferrimonas haliotis]|uniref:Membrane protein n=1 Tax=Paraferrimonas haliotis TaxID=2013866 RepID=A0AA37TJX3_9GAMM|nr:peptidoglycan DD-metalloendopeptidase family protein [Paraferrimonas haliotis]GLS82822.1 membrane protein [Paraferrimonas haliotis]